MTFLGFSFLFFVLTINSSHDFFDLRIRAGIDKMAKQVGQSQEVAKASDSVVFLLYQRC